MLPPKLPVLALIALIGMVLSPPACSLLPFRHKSPPPEKAAARKPMGQGLTVDMQSAPDPVKLADTRQINVTFILRNVTKTTVTLKFPTTQIIEILLRNPNEGQIITQWSSERTFTSDPRLLVINPGERLEYNEPISTRDLKAGAAYTLEAYVVGYEKELRVRKAIVPVP